MRAASEWRAQERAALSPVWMARQGSGPRRREEGPGPRTRQAQHVHVPGWPAGAAGAGVSGVGTSSFISPGGTCSLLSRGVWFRQGESRPLGSGPRPGRPAPSARHSEPRGPALPRGMQPRAPGNVGNPELFRPKSPRQCGRESVAAARPSKPPEDGERGPHSGTRPGDAEDRAPGSGQTPGPAAADTRPGSAVAQTSVASGSSPRPAGAPITAGRRGGCGAARGEA